MTQERVEGRAVPEEPVLFKEPVKKASKGFSIFICSLIVIGVFYSLSSDSKITGTGTLKAQKYTKLQTAVAGTLKEMTAKKGNVVKVINNPNKQKYPKQKMYLIKMKNKIVIVPFIEEINYNFLKTIYPSQKYTKKYLGRNYKLIK